MKQTSKGESQSKTFQHSAPLTHILRDKGEEMSIKLLGSISRAGPKQVPFTGQGPREAAWDYNKHKALTEDLRWCPAKKRKR